MIIVSPPLALAAEVPVVLELVRPVGVAEGVVLVVQVVGGHLLARADVHHGAAHEPHVLRSEADRVGAAGVVDDGADREQALSRVTDHNAATYHVYQHHLDVDVLGPVLGDDVRVGVDDAEDAEDERPGELGEAAVDADEGDDPLLGAAHTGAG